MKTLLITILVLLQVLAMPTRAHALLNPSAVGWGNLVVPGLGATLRGYPRQGLTEAGLELGTYFGGTYGVREGGFTIDGSVKVPTSRNMLSPVIGQSLQEFGLKYHFHNTFYHYQQAAIDAQDTESERNKKQPLYYGSWKDMLGAPFQWKNLSSIWVFPLITASAAYLIYEYQNTEVKRFGFRVSRDAEALYGFQQMAVIPITGAIGEEPLFRGFVMREMRANTGSAVAALAIQSAMFTLVHPSELRASGFLSGIYFGMMTNHFDGNIEPAIAAHFWVNVIDGLIAYWTLQRSQGKETPFAPPITANVTVPF
ncbi:MAG TPA: CPBP family intramembrane glutamic endopeptidase [Bdellovibrionota bacterium]|jgi:membrane protease YdiL (CAAX protease family)